MSNADAPAHTNRLIHATSPYLRQHAHNPVDWHEWGPAALDAARREDKPIFLSIGYSACHWCHVMAHESFEDAEIAAVLNRHFVNIKLDREERPDLDEIYMQATLIMNQGQGGWPMSVWLTPDLKPFFAGTYFPPRAKWGRPGFAEISERIAQAWQDNRAALLASADRLSQALVASLTASAEADAPSLDLIGQTVHALAGAFDPERGGMLGGGRNKFPPSLALDLFLRTALRLGRDQPDARRFIDLVDVTLEHMARGGIYDQLAGGIARYSTDPDWHVPHFEKMLYDQALVSRAYVDAFLVTKKPLFRRIATEILDYVINDLQSPAGGFYSARDADSDGVEGKYYVWTKDEIAGALGPADAALFCSYYDVSETGNWQDPHAPGEAKNVLHILRDREAVARLHGVTPGELEGRLARAREKLLAVRQTRNAPARDEKVLVEWNGLMIASLARGGAALGEPRFVAAAERAADFLLEHQCRAGRLLRSYHDGRALESAFLTDYAALIEGLLDLYEATGQPRWLHRAVALNGVVIEHYHDLDAGGFFLTADDHERLIVRSKPHQDGVTPSGNSTQIMNLLRLSVMLGDESLRTMAEQSLRCFAGDVAQMPGSGERFLAAAEFALLGPVELAVIGPLGDPATQALLAEIHRRYLPNRVVMLADPSASKETPASPLLRDRGMVAGQPTAYVCRDRVCQMPVTTPQALADLLDGAA